MPETLIGLAPLAQPSARVLILGSMPGAESLARQQYYAHPRNLFWPLMAALTGLDASSAYLEKTQALTQSGIAIWDVIASCQRAGSLDSAIRNEQVNDFAAFFKQQPELAAIAFNGAKAWQSFKRHVIATSCVPDAVQLISMPSTSPAHAAMTYDEKLTHWQQLNEFLARK